jgi:parallel beta-helix repeat protein
MRGKFGKKLTTAIISLSLCTAMFCALDFSFGIINVVYGEVLYVNETGSDGAYTHIQDAIDDAIEGDTVFVYGGIYRENLIVDKTLSLIGEDMNNTIIDGGGNVDVVYVSGDWVNITGFTLTNNGPEFKDAGIELNGNRNCKIINNNISDNNWYCIFLYSSSNNIISNNLVSYGGWDNILIWLSSNNTFISNNISYADHWNGIKLSSSSNNTFLKNDVHSNNNYGFHISESHNNDLTQNSIWDNEHGIYIDSSSYNNVTENEVSRNEQYGIYLDYSFYNNITGNFISENLEGIRIEGSSNNNISSNNVTLNKDYGISARGFSYENLYYINCITKNDIGLHIYYSLRNKVKKNNISSNSKYGIESYFTENNVFIENIISDNRRGVYLTKSQYNIFKENRFFDDGISITGYQLSFFNTHDIPVSNTVNGKPIRYIKNYTALDIEGISTGQLILVNCSDVKIKNVEISHTDGGIQIAYSSNISVYKNNISNNLNGIYYHMAYNCSILNSTISNSFFTGVGITDSSDMLISNNNIINNGGHGISIYEVSNISILNNSIFLNYYSGIQSYDSLNSSIMENIISLNGRAIQLDFSENNTLRNNIIEDNDYGIWFYTSTKCNVSNNYINSNTNYGIRLFYLSDHNIIEENNVSNNGEGIRIDFFSSNNSVYHNNIVNNSIQANDTANNGNDWDGGYPLGGNFWSDYSGVDQNKGPNQDQTGSDGIGDTKYFIDSDSFDKYPLMEPYTYKPLENYTILNQGWNLISLPLIQQDQDLQKVLEMIDGYYGAVQWYDPTDPSDPCKHHKVGKPFGNDLFHLNETMGFWIHITNPRDMILTTIRESNHPPS